MLLRDAANRISNLLLKTNKYLMYRLIEKLKNKYNNTDNRSRKMYKNTVIMVFIKGASILISLMSAPIMLHHVNRVDYGVLLTLTSIVSWVGMMDVGLGNGLRNILPEMLAKGNLLGAKKAISSSYAALALYVGLLITIFLMASPFVDWLSVLNSPMSDAAEITGLVIVVFIAFCIQFLLGLIVSILYAYQMPAVNSIISFASQVITFIALIVQIYVFNISSVFQIGAVNCLIPPTLLFLASLLLFFTRLKDVAPTFRLIDFKSVSGILSLGVKFFILQIITIVIFQTNSIIITRVVGPEAVVEYNMAFRYISVLMMFFNIVVTPIWSATTDAYVRGDFSWIQKTLTFSRNICLLLICCGFIMTLFSKQVYNLWLGKDSIDISYATTGLIWIYISFEMLYKVYGIIINGTGKVFAQMIITGAIAVCYVPLAIYLGKTFNLSGVLFANSLVFILNYIWSKVQCSKILSNSAHGFWDK